MMWMTKKAREQLKREIISANDREIKRQLSFGNTVLKEMEQQAVRSVKWDIKGQQTKQIEDTAREFLWGMAKNPPREVIDALVARLNEVQLK